MCNIIFILKKLFDKYALKVESVNSKVKNTNSLKVISRLVKQNMFWLYLRFKKMFWSLYNVVGNMFKLTCMTVQII